MKTLGEAWTWFSATKTNLQRMRRLGTAHWADPSLEGASLWKDNQFKFVTASEIVAETESSLKTIDDLAVLVLFSVFECIVRDFLVASIRPHANAIRDPILRQASDDALRGISEGSFYRRVLEPLKNQNVIPANVITQIDQVRDFRNWVAHGRRDQPVNNVTPEEAYSRLGRFLNELSIPIMSEFDGNQDSERENE